MRAAWDRPFLDLEQALVNPQLWNRYTYALNNPLKFTDPDGRNPLLVGGGIGAAVFGAWKAYVNVQQGRPWYENIGVEASKGFLVGATLGLAGPAISAASLATNTIAEDAAAGTVWAAIKAIQPLVEGTVVPRSFELATGAGRCGSTQTVLSILWSMHKVWLTEV